MNILPKKKLFNTNFYYLLIIILFSFFVNFYYSKLGSFPIDTFLHYDSGYRILNNEIPIRDYWAVSGLVVDVMQAGFFKILGVNWIAYIVHSSTFNSLISIFMYLFFISHKIDKSKALLFTICFTILAYTVSGTPFVDHHAVFFLLITSFLIINNFNSKNFFLWFLIIFLFFLSFLSKQVPASYIAFVYSPLLLWYLIYKKDFKKLFFIISSILIIIGFFLLLLIILKIDFQNFYIQYIDYPQSIGSLRLSNLSLSFDSLISHYKFIIFPILLITLMKLKKIRYNKLKISSDEIFVFILLFVFTFSLIFHQILTKNQIYIYFLIPILFSFVEIEINEVKHKFKQYLSFFMILALCLITIKYHIRYNEERKFHELSIVNLDNTIPAENIHNDLKGLQWLNPYFDGKASLEIEILKKAHQKLNTINNKKIMVITHYQFLESITSVKLNYPNKTFTIEGDSIPTKESKYYDFYKNFLINKIKMKNITEIYLFKHENIFPEIITNYLNKDCYEIKEDEIFYIYELSCFN
jgi:hypothetical protein